MFCPLCRAAFRQEFMGCASCGATLVPSLEADSVRENPPRLLWIGKNLVEFDLVATALRDVQIPAHAERGLGGLVGALVNSLSKVHVLQSDFDRALDVAAHAGDQKPRTEKESQGCYRCGAECSAALTSCPKCGAVLIVATEERSGTELPEPAARALKYCPLCDAEYTATFDRCTLCDIELVSEELRGQPLNERERRERIVLVWKAGDPVAVSRGIAALRDAGIQHHVKATHDHFVFELGIPRPKYEIRVFESDAESARNLLTGISESLPFSLSVDEPSRPEEHQRTPAAHPASVSAKPSQATAEIWSGDDTGFAQILQDCLRENSIAFRREGREPGNLRIFVPPSDAAPAREILRELREGTPLT